MYPKIKRILALTGAILLVIMYAISFFLGISNHPNALRMLIASLYATFFVSTMIYVFQLVYKITRKSDDNNDKDSNDTKTKES